MPNLDEKLAFEHGLRVMLKMMEGCANEAMSDGQKGNAYFLMGIVDAAEKDIHEIADMYHKSGFDDLMRQVSVASITPEK